MVIAVGYEKDGVSSKSTVRDETVKLQLLLLKVSVTVGCALGPWQSSRYRRNVACVSH